MIQDVVEQLTQKLDISSVKFGFVNGYGYDIDNLPIIYLYRIRIVSINYLYRIHIVSINVKSVFHQDE
jgi:hypothetical protein